MDFAKRLSRLSIAFAACAFCILNSGCSESATTATVAAAATSYYTTITATVGGVYSTYYGYSPYDCALEYNSENVPILTITAYSGGCEYCGDTLTFYLSDANLTNGETITCDGSQHYITYDVPATAFYSASTSKGGSCSDLQLNSFNPAASSQINGSLVQSILIPTPNENSNGVISTLPITYADFNCSDLYINPN